MPPRIERIEARVEHDRAERIRYAATLARSSVSSFVVDAASERAERVIADHDETSVGPKFFEDMLRVLDELPKVILPLKRAASRARVVKKRGR
ncbi:MAG: DUF1778 domain-containing protein [Actinomycetota bacterium]|nr:DUF1778 domain-containing protein [Actinomycetota bacterium]